MNDRYTSDFIEFLCESPGVFHAVDAIGRRLERARFLLLDEREPAWDLVPGGRYYVTRNDSACIAFRLPAGSLPTYRDPGLPADMFPLSV